MNLENRRRKDFIQQKRIFRLFDSVTMFKNAGGRDPTSCVGSGAG